jgi:plasmid stabilization system protein ParE
LIVYFTARARRRLAVVATWWREHRPSAPDLFETELATAIESIRSRPSVGTVHADLRGDIVRRVLLPESEQHLYDSVDPVANVVALLTIWGARRGRPPKL